MFSLVPKSATFGSGVRWYGTLLSKHKTPLGAICSATNEQKREFNQTAGDVVAPLLVRGIDHMRDPRLNKGLAFTLEERQMLGIHGLQPPRIKTQEEQLELCRISIMRYQEDLNKYLYMNELHDRNEKLFFRLLAENVEMLMPIVYTPTVGLACQKFGLIYRRPRGIFVTINDKGHVFDVLKNWPEHDIKAIVVTDGERILGLGDLGACGMGIPVGKLALYTALAGIKPHQCLPVLLDVGTNNEQMLEDPLYIGLRQKRVQGPEYDEFVDEFMAASRKLFGQDVLIQFEDFGNKNANRFLEKYRNQYCTFNDDIQGTASVAVAGLMSAERITKVDMCDQKYLFFGAGGASCGIADLTVKAMAMRGIPTEEARSKIFMVDINGLITNGRPEGLTSKRHLKYVKDLPPEKDLLKIVETIKPTVLIGASTVGGAFTPEVIKQMGKNAERPIIFALSNPTVKAECTAENAYLHSENRAIFASGSPFGTVVVNGQTFKPGQGNNAYIFPGIALGVIACRIHHISDELFLTASQIVANSVSQEDLEQGALYPPLKMIRDISIKIATEICTFSYAKGLATVYPEPEDKLALVQQQIYNFNYEQALPSTYEWKKPPPIKTRPLSEKDLLKR